MKYFAMLNGEQKGPYTLEELPDAGVYPDTYVWCKEMKDWQKAEEVADICRYFRRRLIGVPGEMPESPQDEAERLRREQWQERSEKLAEIPVRYRRQVDESGTDFEPPTEQEPDYSHPPKYYLFESIIATLFCFLFTGVIAIYFSWRARRAWQNGAKEESYDYAGSARMWVGITFFMGVIFMGFAMMKVMG